MQLFRESPLTPNKYSRPQTPLKEVRGITLHWVENPGTSADFNRNYFEMRKSGQHGYGSAHYIIDNRGILQCIPEDEMAYHVGAQSYTALALRFDWRSLGHNGAASREVGESALDSVDAGRHGQETLDILTG